MSCHPRKLLIQTTLDRWVSGVRRKPCYLDRLPPELFLDILGYLPFETKCAKQHCDPFKLPEGDELPPYLDAAPRTPPLLDSLSDCPANRRFRNGCEEYCPQDLHPWNWLEVIRVSRAWRSACLACQRFWTRVPLHNWLRACDAIKRSGELPLQVYFNVSQGQSHALTAVLNSASSRLSELSISCGCLTEYEYTNIVNLLGELHVPMLQKWCFRAHPFAIARPPRIFKGLTIPLLRHLELQEMELSHCPNLFSPSLVHLQLSDCHDVWRTARDMTDTLRRTPLLRDLLLFGDPCFPEDMFDSTYVPLGEPIALRDLRVFQISADSQLVLNLLRTLHIPFGSSVGITLRHTKSIDSQYSDTFTAFLAKQLEPMKRDVRSFTHTRFQIEQHLNSEGPESHWALIRMDWGGAGSQPATGSPAHLTIQHTWDGGVATTMATVQDVHALMNAYVSVLPCSSAENLSIEPWVYSTYLRQLGGDELYLLHPLVCFSNIRHLIFAFDIEDALYWLVSESQSATSTSTPSSKFPELQTLEVRRFRFKPTFVPWLHSYVHWRKDVLGRPCAIKLVHCYADGDDDEYVRTLGVLSKIPGVQFENNNRYRYPDLEQPLAGVPERWFM